MEKKICNYTGIWYKRNTKDSQIKKFAN